MSFFAVQVGNSFGYFKSFKNAKDVYEEKCGAELVSIRKVSANKYTGVFSEVGDDISHLSVEGYNEPNDKQPEKLYTIGLPGVTMKFHETERAAAFYNDEQLGMTEQILLHMGNMEDYRDGTLIGGSYKYVYGLSYIFDKCAKGDIRPLGDVFADMKRRGDMYEIHLGQFGILRPMGYVHDTIEDSHRLVYKMANNYRELYDLIGYK
uniref:Uncharacterized protein n=1 Tax=Pithovirus LCPAC401 TaxID=2506595 RepID=A0A481ZCX4_9VIRU|nr:MAG: uncharacterized protein LCPAC401_01590 [Pithovirus LCPAC401]